MNKEIDNNDSTYYHLTAAVFIYIFLEKVHFDIEIYVFMFYKIGRKLISTYKIITPTMFLICVYYYFLIESERIVQNFVSVIKYHIFSDLLLV